MLFSLSLCFGSINRNYLFEVRRHRAKCEGGRVHITPLLKSLRPRFEGSAGVCPLCRVVIRHGRLPGNAERILV